MAERKGKQGQLSYVAYRTKDSEEDEHYELGKVFDTVKEASEFFGVKETTVRTISRDLHGIRGKRKETWMIFQDTELIREVEAQLGRRL